MDEFINLGNDTVISKADYLEAMKKSDNTEVCYNGKVVGNYTDFKIDENGNIVYTIKFTDDKTFKDISKNDIISISSRGIVDENIIKKENND